MLRVCAILCRYSNSQEIDNFIVLNERFSTFSDGSCLPFYANSQKRRFRYQSIIHIVHKAYQGSMYTYHHIHSLYWPLTLLVSCKKHIILENTTISRDMYAFYTIPKQLSKFQSLLPSHFLDNNKPMNEINKERFTFSWTKCIYPHVHAVTQTLFSLLISTYLSSFFQ